MMYVCLSIVAFLKAQSFSEIFVSLMRIFHPKHKWTKKVLEIHSDHSHSPRVQRQAVQVISQLVLLGPKAGLAHVTDGFQWSISFPGTKLP